MFCLIISSLCLFWDALCLFFQQCFFFKILALQNSGAVFILIWTFFTLILENSVFFKGKKTNFCEQENVQKIQVSLGLYVLQLLFFL